MIQYTRSLDHIQYVLRKGGTNGRVAWHILHGVRSTLYILLYSTVEYELLMATVGRLMEGWHLMVWTAE